MSDSSDDEINERLRESVDPNFICDSMYSEKKEDTSKVQTQTTQKSLRHQPEEDADKYNGLKVTPEFQNYVAKALMEIIDDKLQKQLKYNVNDSSDTKRKKRKKSGVKLFSNSTKCIKLTESVPCYRTVKKREESSDEDIEKYRSVAVTSETVLSREEIKNWSDRTRGELFRYKKHKDGQLHYIKTPFV